MFLEYIVQSGHISKQQLLEAVAAQMESMPSLIRLLLEEERCSVDEVFSLLIEGAKKNFSLYEMIREKNVLSDEEIHNFLNKQNLKSKSLGDLLISQKALTREQYDQILRDYASSKGNQTADAPAPTPEVVEQSPTVSESKDAEVPAESSAPAAPAGISAAALESLMAVQGLDQDMIAELESGVSSASQEESSSTVDEETTESTPAENESTEVKQAEEQTDNQPVDISSASPTLGEYLDFYSEPLQSELFVTANRYRLKGKVRDLEFIHENVLKILSLAKLNGFDFQIKLLEPYENYMGDLLNQGIDAPEDWRSCPSEMLELLWEFRKTVVEGKSEGQLLANKDNKEKYINNLKTVMSYIKRSA